MKSKKFRAKEFLKTFILVSICAFAVCMALGALMWTISRGKGVSFWNCVKGAFLFFGVPPLIFPFIELLYPDYEHSYGISAWIYYGGVFCGIALETLASAVLSDLIFSGFVFSVAAAILVLERNRSNQQRADALNAEFTRAIDLYNKRLAALTVVNQSTGDVISTIGELEQYIKERECAENTETLQ